MDKKQKQVGVVVPVIRDRILIMRRSPKEPKHTHKWDFPAGKIEKGETPRIGALRELKEEAGIQAQPEELKHIETFEDGKKKVHLYRLDLKRANVRCRDGEHDRYAWVTLCQVGCYNLTKGAQDTLYEHGVVDDLMERKK